MQAILILLAFSIFGCGSALLERRSAPEWKLSSTVDPIDDAIVNTLSIEGRIFEPEGDSFDDPPVFEIRRSEKAGLEIYIRTDEFYHNTLWDRVITTRVDQSTGISVDWRVVRESNDLFYVFAHPNPSEFLTELLSGKNLLVRINFKYAGGGPRHMLWTFDVTGLDKMLSAID